MGRWYSGYVSSIDLTIISSIKWLESTSGETENCSSSFRQLELLVENRGSFSVHLNIEFVSMNIISQEWRWFWMILNVTLRLSKLSIFSCWIILLYISCFTFDNDLFEVVNVQFSSRIFVSPLTFLKWRCFYFFTVLWPCDVKLHNAVKFSDVYLWIFNVMLKNFVSEAVADFIVWRTFQIGPSLQYAKETRLFRRISSSPNCLKDCIYELKEASTHKCAKTHAGTIFDSWSWPWTFWSQNKWIFRTYRGNNLYFNFDDPSFIGFWYIVRKTDTETDSSKKPSHATAVDMGNEL